MSSRAPVPSLTTKPPAPVPPTPVLCPVITRVPSAPSNVPANVPVSLAMNEPSGWIISEPWAIRVPAKLPVRVAVSLTVMIVLPPAVVTESTVNDAVKVPVAVVGGLACANGAIGASSAMSLGVLFSFFVVCPSSGLIYSRVRSDFRIREVFLLTHTLDECGLEGFSSAGCASRECSSELQVPRPTRLPICSGGTRPTETSGRPWYPAGILALRRPGRFRSGRLDALLQGRLEERRRDQSPRNRRCRLRYMETGRRSVRTSMATRSPKSRQESDFCTRNSTLR